MTAHGMKVALKNRDEPFGDGMVKLNANLLKICNGSFLRIGNYQCLRTSSVTIWHPGSDALL